MHLARCNYCWTARAQLYHRCIPCKNSKSFWLQCGYCAKTFRRSSDLWMVYPCGWWEHPGNKCRCAYMDMLGYLVDDGTPIFTIDTFLMEHLTWLRIDYINGHGSVKFIGQAKLHDRNTGDIDSLWKQISLQNEINIHDSNGEDIEFLYNDDDHRTLLLSEIIHTKAFRGMLPFLRYFQKYTRPKLSAIRRNSLVLQYVPLNVIKRLSRSNHALKFLIRYVWPPTDENLIKYLYRQKQNHPATRDLTQSAWQWMQFINPITQGRWLWRIADGEWFNISPNQCTGYGPAGTWKRYRDPTSYRCFWWRDNENWGWEQD